MASFDYDYDLINYDKKLILLKELANLSGNDFRYKLLEHKYGTSGDNLPAKLINKVTDKLFGKSNRITTLKKKRKSPFLFKPTTKFDHLVTPFDKTVKDARGKNFLRLKIKNSEKDKPGKNCTILIQDQECNNIFSTTCYVFSPKCYLSKKTCAPDGYIFRYLTIPENVEKVRINIFSDDGTPTYIPEAIILEQCVLPNSSLTDEEKRATELMIRILSPRAELTAFRDSQRIPRFIDHEYEEFVSAYSRDLLRDFFEDDPWFANFILNIWEYVQGESELTTYPWNVCIPIADTCNATCLFCTSWYRGTRQLGLDEINNFRPLLKNARFFGFAGHGEPLMHTEFEKVVLTIFKSVDPRCCFYLVTNGALLDRYLDLLIELNFRTYNISLNAATAETHEQVMGLGKNTFDRIISCIDRLVSVREKAGTRWVPAVNISMVVINQNIHEAASFVELGNRLKVNNIYLNTLMPQSTPIQGLNYHTLAPYLNPDFSSYREKAKRAIKASKINVIGSPEAWGTPVLPKHLEEQCKINPPPIVTTKEVRRNPANYRVQEPLQKTKGYPLSLSDKPTISEKIPDANPYGRVPRYSCKTVYYSLNLNDFSFRLNPCCYMWDIPGFEPMVYDGSCDFFEVWNSPALVELRKRLKEGPLYSYCKRCPPQG
jgi:sulfatase maturation enzyme AslB (radical SAM superfamily)